MDTEISNKNRNMMLNANDHCHATEKLQIYKDIAIWEKWKKGKNWGKMDI